MWQPLIKYAKYLLLILCGMAGHTGTYAQLKGEDILIDQLMYNLRTKDAVSYTTQFAGFDSVWRLVTSYSPATAEEAKRIDNLKQHPERLKKFDPQYNGELSGNFKLILMKGIDSGIHWTEILMVRYKLEKMLLPRELLGFDMIAQHRLQGFVYFEDMLTNKRYALAVRNIFSLNNKWYGGEIVNVQEAQSEEEYFEKLAGERKAEKAMLLAKLYGEPDKPEEKKKEKKKKADSRTGERDYLQMDIEEYEEEDEDEQRYQLKKVIDRKFYTGKLDEELHIELYLRSLQGDCPEPVCGWEAIYRFGKNEAYFWLDVKKRADGTFYMLEDTEEGAMELTLNNGKLTGVWQSPQDKTEYKVEMEETEVKAKTLYALDDLIEGY